MSRSYGWSYDVVLPRTALNYDLYTSVFGYLEEENYNRTRRKAKSPIAPKYLEGGSYTGEDPAEISVWLWANRAKSKRLKITLDNHFGAIGTLILLNDLYGDDE